MEYRERFSARIGFIAATDTESSVLIEFKSSRILLIYINLMNTTIVNGKFN